MSEVKKKYHKCKYCRHLKYSEWENVYYCRFVANEMTKQETEREENVCKQFNCWFEKV